MKRHFITIIIAFNANVRKYFWQSEKLHIILQMITGGQTPCETCEVWLTRPPVSFFSFFLDV